MDVATLLLRLPPLFVKCACPMPNKNGCSICGKDRRQRCLCAPGTLGSLKEHAVNTGLQTKTRSCEDALMLASPRAKKEKHEHPNKTTQRAKEKHREKKHKRDREHKMKKEKKHKRKKDKHRKKDER